METKALSRVAPFWRDLAILLVGATPAFFFGVNFARSLPSNTAPANAVVATTTAPPKAK